MRFIFPLPSIDESKMRKLHAVYGGTTRDDVYDNVRIARNRNVFIDNNDDFDWIMDNIVIAYGLDRSDIGNLYTKQNCRGINFNVITASDWVREHSDVNPSKINILLTKQHGSNIRFVETSEEWDYRTPALLDVSQRHLVTNVERLDQPRVMMQIFITKPFGHCVEKIRRKLSL